MLLVDSFDCSDLLSRPELIDDDCDVSLRSTDAKSSLLYVSYVLNLVR